LARILVIDDEKDITLVLKKALELDGFTVDTYTSPEEALDHFKQDYYDMIITDIRMPAISGFEVYRRVRKLDGKVKVAFMTAFEIYDGEFKKVLPSIETKYFFKKPIHLTTLIQRVKEALGEDFTMS
jgi:DNA-binding response OmpR family regulator